VLSDIIRHSEFDSSTRAASLECIAVFAECLSNIVKNNGMNQQQFMDKLHLFFSNLPALMVSMINEDDGKEDEIDDIGEWVMIDTTYTNSSCGIDEVENDTASYAMQVFFSFVSFAIFE
jgi:hypothetical protein